MVRLDDRPHKMWGHSASPLLIGDRLFVNIDSLTALNARTGAELWRKKYNQCWGSTQAIRVGDVDVLVLGNGKFVRATDGQVLARAMTPSNVSPIIHGRKVYFIQDPAQAVEVPEALGATLELKTLWEREVRGGTVFASPVLHRGLLWSLSASGVLNVLDAETGKLIKNRRLDFGSGKVYPSLTVAGDYLYASHDSGATAVLRADESAEEIGRNHLDSFMSTPLCHDSQLLIRTRSGLYCIGQKR